MQKNKVILTVGKYPKGSGYSIFHNQPKGFYGTYENWFSWYKYKSEAIKRANELMISFNKPQTQPK